MNGCNTQRRPGMTNREKFKDVFGLEIDEMPSDLCDIVDHKICIDANDCPSCPVFHFWDKEFSEKGDENGN